MQLREIEPLLWEIQDGREDAHVPARIFADRELLDAIQGDDSLVQLQNVATLPGIVHAAIAMPDIHAGYGFPVGTVAATALPDGVISPGGVGYDINCGVRLLTLPLTAQELHNRKEALVHEISRRAPAGTGREGGLRLSHKELDKVLIDGARALVWRDIGTAEDVLHTESEGCLPGAHPEQVSHRARERGAAQLGTLGSGNHFLELQTVDRLFDQEAASAYGLTEGAVTALIHSGSRGLGHQVCTDFVKRMDAALGRHGITLPDRQLSCAPAFSAEGAAYLAAMAAAANFAWANRQALAHAIRESVRHVLGKQAADETRQVYDVAHNVAKREEHGGEEVLVHRKGATRAFPPGHPELPEAHRKSGQAIFVPGSMGTASYVLAGRPGAMERAFGTVCHGAGRAMSRTGARKHVRGEDLRRELEQQGITVRCPSNKGLAEEAPFAYKDVEKVVDVVERAGLAVRVARLRPIGVVKG
jgi:tRNA-splicing ligase RtcB (3'-phosphate/5'-hydroxy nucleic acid ligase)